MKEPKKSRLTPGRIKKDYPRTTIARNKSNKDGHTFPLTVAKITRVDPRKLVVDLQTVNGPLLIYSDIAIPFPGSGARNFLGALPQEEDLCVIGYTYGESGYSRQPVILSWLMPAANAAYSWTMTQSIAQSDIAMTPANKEALKGLAGRRRLKAHILESGNVAASSAQGSDLILNESITIANRRGNEVVLRDQDQALVVRSLQQFHAGAGFRLYGGMIQRDGTFLPSQMVSDGIDWDSDRQVDEGGRPLRPSKLSSNSSQGSVLTDKAFESEVLFPANLDPNLILARGLFIDENGKIYDDLVEPDTVYGGKPIYRVAQTENGVSSGRTFSEYRVEVAHTSDGTLPVTEQTDGIDVDRLLPAAPKNDGSADASNRSSNAPMVEFVLGTAVGNDPFGDRGSYAKPLKPVLYTQDGRLSPGLVPAEDGDPITDHAAFLVRVKNPTDPSAPDAFMAITKGGTYRSYFPGKGSKGLQEAFGTGKTSNLGVDDDGQSYTVNADGSISLLNNGKSRTTDNVGVEISSTGAVTIYGGGAKTGPAEGVYGVQIDSIAGVRVRSSTNVKLSSPTILLEESNSISLTANSSVAVNSGDLVSINAKSHSVTISGRADYTFGGPKDALATNGPSRVTTFAASPITGAIGGVVDDYTVAFGKRQETFLIGRHDTNILLGSFNVTTANPIALPASSFGDGINLSAGPTGLNQSLELSSPLAGGGALLQANLGNVTLRATKGQAVIQAVAGISATSLAPVTVTAPSMTVTVPTANPGGVITDGVIDGFSGRPLILAGTLGVQTFRVGA